MITTSWIQPKYQLKIFLLSLLLTAWFLRVINLEADSLWGNEIFSVNVASQPTLQASYQILAVDDHPPLYDLGLMRHWLALGKLEYLLRFPSAAFGLLAICLTYALGRVIFSIPSALVGASLLAIAPLHLYYSREARSYTLLAVFTLLWLYCLMQAIRSDRTNNRYWLGYTVFGAASLYTHYYAGFTLLPVAGFVFLWGIAQRDMELLQRWGAANVGLTLLFLPWLPTFLAQMQDNPVSHLVTVTPLQLVKMPAQFFTGFEDIPVVIDILIAGTVYGLLGFGLWVAMRAAIPVTSRNGYLLLTSALAGTFLLAFLISLVKPVIFLRYFVGVVPVACLLLAFALTNFKLRLIGLPLAGLLVAVSLLAGYHVTTDSWRKDYRSLTDYLETHASPDDAVLIFSPDDHPILVAGMDYYYAGNPELTYLFGQRANPETLSTQLGQLNPNQGAWVVQIRQVMALDQRYDHHVVSHHQQFHSRLFRLPEEMSLTYLESIENEGYARTTNEDP